MWPWRTHRASVGCLDWKTMFIAWKNKQTHKGKERSFGMLGDLLGELDGKVSYMKVLPDGKVEASIQQSGKVLGVELNNIVTYVSEMRPDGTLYGVGQGVGMSKEGDMVTWKGTGVGWPTGPGQMAYRGALYFSTASPKLARLNKIVGIYEYESHQDGSDHMKIWEWK